MSKIDNKKNNINFINRLKKDKMIYVLGISGLLLLSALLIGLPTYRKLNARLSPPKVLAFYYDWYGNTTAYDGELPSVNSTWLHWTENNHNPPYTIAANHTPVLGAFDSADNNTIKKHFDWADYAHIDAFIATWWGKGGYTDYNFRKLLRYANDHNRSIELTIYFESVQTRYKDNWTLAADQFVYVLENYAQDPHFLKFDDRPVIFIYSIGVLGSENFTKIVNYIHAKGYYPFLIADLGNPNNANQEWIKIFDGYHIYNPAGLYRDHKNVYSLYSTMNYYARINGKLSCLTVIPGYNDFAVCNPNGSRNTWFKVDRENGTLYINGWKDAIKINPDWILITTFNEWHEGSEIEPSLEYGDYYINLTRTYAGIFKSNN
ncbi:MAG: hypothetical protein ACTSU2_09775 [Promethearchaeota archaeon]